MDDENNEEKTVASEQTISIDKCDANLNRITRCIKIGNASFALAKTSW